MVSRFLIGLSENMADNILKISNVRSLSPNDNRVQQQQQQAYAAPLIWTDLKTKCLMCCNDIVRSHLQEHMLDHFSFYRPYQCKQCPKKFGDIDVYITEHIPSSGHDEGIVTVGEKLEYVEDLIQMITLHCRRVGIGELENVLSDLEKMKISAAGSSSAPMSNGFSSPLISTGRTTRNSIQAAAFAVQENHLSSPNLTRNRNDSSLSVGLESACTIGSAEAQQMRSQVSSSPVILSPDRQQRSTKRSRITSDSNKRKALYLSCNLCSTNVHADDRDAHLSTKHARRTAEECFHNAQQAYLTDDEDEEAMDGVESVGVHAPQSPNDFNMPQSPDPLLTVATGTSNKPPLDGAARSNVADSNYLGDNFRTSSSDSNISSPPSTPRSTATPKACDNITCDYCQKICENQELLKFHVVENHVGGFRPFHCTMCSIEEPNQRRLIEHGRSVHKNAKAVKRTMPTEEQKSRLKEIKEMLAKKGIDLDLGVYGVN